jgi:hypothetical protein
LNESAELTTLQYKTLTVIIRLTFQHGESKVGIAANVGGVEAVLKVKKTCPKCQALQEGACDALRNLACCSIGQAKAIESGGIEVLVAAVATHLGSANLCLSACSALVNTVRGSKENTELLIDLGGGAAVAKVRKGWPDDDVVQTQVQRLAKLLAAEMNSWGDEE